MSEPQTPFIGQDGQPSPAPVCDGRDRIIMELQASEARLVAAIESTLAHVEDPDLRRVPDGQCTLCARYRNELRGAIAAAKGTAS